MQNIFKIYIYISTNYVQVLKAADINVCKAEFLKRLICNMDHFLYKMYLTRREILP